MHRPKVIITERLKNEICNINEEIRRMGNITGSWYNHKKVTWKTLKKMSRQQLMKSILYRNIILSQQRTALSDARYRYKVTLIRFRKALIENYLMKSTVQNKRNFKYVSFKKIIAKSNTW